MKPFLSNSFMRLEINFGQSTIFGLVVAGSIDLVYAKNMRLLNWDVEYLSP